MVIVNQPQESSLRHKVIQWLTQALGEQQQRIKALEAENANLRDSLKRGHQSPLTRPVVKVKGASNGY